VFFGGAGDDYLKAMATAVGNTAMNHLDGGAGNDTLIGTVSKDALGLSELFGGAGDDYLRAIGGDGNRLEGGLGDDDLIGSIGQDNFLYEKPGCGNLGWDDIFGFQDNQDKVVLDGYAPADLSLDTATNVASLSDGTMIHFVNINGDLTPDDFVFIDGLAMA
jgi:serralysin